MKRREFITLVGGAVAAAPRAVRAQQAAKIARIGVLSTGNPRSAPFYRAFEQRLRDLGFVEGQNIAFEYRDAEGMVDRLPGLAAELVRLDVNVSAGSEYPLSLHDGEVDLMRGFSLSSSEGIGSAWKAQSSTETFDDRFGRW
jgi:putative ABC transport system substrate-binding protein